MSSAHWLCYPIDDDTAVEDESVWAIALAENDNLITTLSCIDPLSQRSLRDALKEGIQFSPMDASLHDRLIQLGMPSTTALEVLAAHRFTEHVDLVGEDIFLGVREAERPSLTEMPQLVELQLSNGSVVAVAVAGDSGHLRVITLGGVDLPHGAAPENHIPEFVALRVPVRACRRLVAGALH